MALVFSMALVRAGAALTNEEIVFLVEYIGADYGVAVQRGRIANALEYQEVQRFSQRAGAAWDAHPAATRNPAIASLFAEQARLIGEMATWEEVRSVSSELAERLSDLLDVTVSPTHRPDIGRGALLYAEACASCHGSDGAGDGAQGAEMVPPPASFRDIRMNFISPHQTYAATAFGVDGTGMPAFADSLSAVDLWDVSFFLQTLREGFLPAVPPPAARRDLRSLSQHANATLLDRDESGVLTLQHLDHMRAFPPPVVRPVAADSVEVRSDRGSAGPTGLDLALQLEEAFAAVVDRSFPSVVGVVAYAPSIAPAKEESRWRGAPADVEREGFDVVGMGSGFFVSKDGTILTRYLSLVDAASGEVARDIAVVLPGDKRHDARLVGAEPSIDLAVLRIVVPFETAPLDLANSDLAQPGRWALLLADPPGIRRTFAAGSIAAVPSRECYQERRGGTLFQTSLHADRDSFGGPVVDIRGRVIGMAVPPLEEVAERARVLVLPSKLAKTISDALRMAESKRSPWLGISVLELSRELRRKVSEPPRTGVYIDGIFEGGPAERAGVQVGDVLTKIDDHLIVSVGGFQKWLYLSGAGRQVRLEVSRSGKSLYFAVSIEERPAEAAMIDL